MQTRNYYLHAYTQMPETVEKIVAGTKNVAVRVDLELYKAIKRKLADDPSGTIQALIVRLLAHYASGAVPAVQFDGGAAITAHGEGEPSHITNSHPSTVTIQLSELTASLSDMHEKFDRLFKILVNKAGRHGDGKRTGNSRDDSKAALAALGRGIDRQLARIKKSERDEDKNMPARNGATEKKRPRDRRLA